MQWSLGLVIIVLVSVLHVLEGHVDSTYCKVETSCDYQLDYQTDN